MVFTVIDFFNILVLQEYLVLALGRLKLTHTEVSA